MLVKSIITIDLKSKFLPWDRESYAMPTEGIVKLDDEKCVS